MGNALSTSSIRKGSVTESKFSESETMSDTNALSSDDSGGNNEEFHDASTGFEDDARSKAKDKAMSRFRQELEIKREQRKRILARHRSEKEDLEKSLTTEKKSNLELSESNRLLRELLIRNNIEIPQELESDQDGSDVTSAITNLRDEMDKLKANNLKLRKELVESNSSLQGAYSDIADLNEQNTETMKHITALKEVVRVSKTMLGLREEQLQELKNKLSEIERSLADREASMLSTDLREEYQRQLQNIRTLRGLYEERARLAEVTRQGLLREIEEQKSTYQFEVNKSNELKTKIEALEAEVTKLTETIDNQNDVLRSCEDETRGLKAEMLAVNMLFSQVLLGYKNKQDLDQLVHRLEENHGLLTQMAEREAGSEASALPKLLLELVSQVDDAEKHSEEKTETVNEDTEIPEKESTSQSNTAVQEIVENLPKVWRVLTELLSHQNEIVPDAMEKVTTCYKSVDTKSGPVLVPSVSQTYIRLKDLILEKLSLIKEVKRMKQLNTHLESRLEVQEKKLCIVTSELTKTWHVVGRLRKHHHQLHTHEKILKYELQQKRKLLNELKEELEYCREKCDQAREKNTQSEKDWKKLRAEFSSRKNKVVSTSINNSAESGYSDERQSDSTDSNDDSEYLNEPSVRCKKKLKKSFETILDSSTDRNIAEREDPVSDMIDVAELPLDAQDGDDNHEISVSDSCTEDNLNKSEPTCIETEDEVGDMGNESCIEDSPIAKNCDDCDNNSDVSISENCVITTVENQVKGGTNIVQEATSGIEQVETSNSQINMDMCLPTNVETPIPKIDPVAIMESIKQQNERLAKRDKKLAELESSSADLLNKAESTIKFGEKLTIALDNVLSRPSVSFNKEDEQETEKTNAITQKKEERNEPFDLNTLPNVEKPANNQTTIITQSYEAETKSNKNEEADINCKMVDDSLLSCSINDPGSAEMSALIDPKAILENEQNQNEYLRKKDERLETLEAGCSGVNQSISETLNDDIMKKMDDLNINNENNIERENSPADSDTSTSTNSHEAILAARDLRLKMLEEQTKSLVNRVNKTNSKGVKIHYKLQELHNIYGSESSRAGTPSGGVEDNTDDDDEEEHSLKSNSE